MVSLVHAPCFMRAVVFPLPPCHPWVLPCGLRPEPWGICRGVEASVDFLEHLTCSVSP